MPFFLVKLRRMIEWERIYEAPTDGVAEDLAKQEAHHGTIIDEQVIIHEVSEADRVD